MEPEAKSEQEGAAESGSGVEREGEGEAGRKLDSQRVEQLSRFLRHQQEVVYRSVSLSLSPSLPPSLPQAGERCQVLLPRPAEGSQQVLGADPP